MARELPQRAGMPAHHPLASARTQAAVVRTLVDQFEHAITNANSGHSLPAQLVEELATLGRRILDAAAALTEAIGTRPA